MNWRNIELWVFGNHVAPQEGANSRVKLADPWGTVELRKGNVLLDDVFQLLTQTYADLSLNLPVI